MKNSPKTRFDVHGDLKIYEKALACLQEPHFHLSESYIQVTSICTTKHIEIIKFKLVHYWTRYFLANI